MDEQINIEKPVKAGFMLTPATYHPFRDYCKAEGFEISKFVERLIIKEMRNLKIARLGESRRA